MCIRDSPTHDGTGVRDYIHVVDLAKGHVKAIEYSAEHKGTEDVYKRQSDEDAEGREFTNKQYENFIHVRDSLKKRGVDIRVVHCSNSGAIDDYPETCCDMVRAGIILDVYKRQGIRKFLSIKRIRVLIR